MPSDYHKIRRSVDRLGEDPGTLGSLAFASPLVRDRCADPGGELGRPEGYQSGANCEGGGDGFTPAGGAGSTAHRSRSNHPLLLFNKEGHCLGAKLRSDNVHSAEDWTQCFCPRLIVNRDWQSAAESVYELAGVRRRCCRSGHKRATLGCAAADEDRRKCSLMKNRFTVWRRSETRIL
jgi:hypothetical protein